MNLSVIPSADDMPADAVSSVLVARLRQIKPSRRTVFKGLMVSAMASTLVPLDWAINKRAAFAGPTSEHTSCPWDYTPSSANWWSGTGQCTGGWRRGSWPCASKYHFEGFRSYSDEGYTSNRVTTYCSSRNAWRWNGYRCSDAMTTTVWNSGERHYDLTIAQCAV